MTDVYGCKSLYGTYDFPWNTMSQDWGSDQVTGFYYHEISEECKAAGGELPTIIQVYTYIVCEQNRFDAGIRKMAHAKDGRIGSV